MEAENTNKDPIKFAFMMAAGIGYAALDLLQIAVNNGAVFAGDQFLKAYGASFMGGIFWTAYANYMNYLDNFSFSSGSETFRNAVAKYPTEFNTAVVGVGLTGVEILSSMARGWPFDWGDMVAYGIALGLTYKAFKYFDKRQQDLGSLQL